MIKILYNRKVYIIYIKFRFNTLVFKYRVLKSSEPLFYQYVIMMKFGGRATSIFKQVGREICLEILATSYFINWDQGDGLVRKLLKCTKYVCFDFF